MRIPHLCWFILQYLNPFCMCLCENENIMCDTTAYKCLKKFKNKKHIKDVKKMVCSPEGFCRVSAVVKYGLKKKKKKKKEKATLEI